MVLLFVKLFGRNLTLLNVAIWSGKTALSHIGSLSGRQINLSGRPKHIVLHCRLGAFAMQERPSCNAKGVLLQTKSTPFARLKSEYIYFRICNTLSYRALRKPSKIRVFRSTGKLFQNIARIFDVLSDKFRVFNI